MTPAEKPSDAARNDRFVRFAKIAARLPIPVARPANAVSPSANGHMLSKDETSMTSGTEAMMSRPVSRDTEVVEAQASVPMPRIAPFEAHHERYDLWFERHEAAYYSG